MHLREATPEDIPAIIDLLKCSLGESKISKTPQLWTWKHLENPFGKSAVLIAEDKGIIVGVRAFMRWDWLKGEQKIKTLRAVDTAVHPDFQRQGIFKNLTLKLVKACNDEDYQFIFNTPNTNSMQGYLKMGWRKKGKLPLQLAITGSFRLFWSKKDHPVPEFPQRNWPLALLPPFEQTSEDESLRTPISVAYITWRYVNNPLFRYGYFTDEVSYLCIFRIKSHGRFYELRINELIPLKPNGKINGKHFKRQLKIQASLYAISLISFSGGASYPLPAFGTFGFVNVPAGPMITLRNLGMSGSSFEALFTSKSFAFSLGDLELF